MRRAFGGVSTNPYNSELRVETISHAEQVRNIESSQKKPRRRQENRPQSRRHREGRPPRPRRSCTPEEKVFCAGRRRGQASQISDQISTSQTSSRRKGRFRTTRGSRPCLPHIDRNSSQTSQRPSRQFRQTRHRRPRAAFRHLRTPQRRQIHPL
jgi:hypothetical protein